MASVIQPGWLLLFMCSAVLLMIGWYLLQRSTREVEYSVPLMTPVYAAAPIWTPQPLYTVVPPPIVPTSASTDIVGIPKSSLILEKPTCYDNPAHHLMCVGRIYNSLDVPIENIQVDIQVSSDDGTFIKTALSEQRVLPPDSYAPYHARFTDYQKLYEESITVDVSPHDPTYSPYVPLSLPLFGEKFSQKNPHGQYLLAGTVYNAQPYSLQQVEIVGMLLDNLGRITGYRVLRLPDGLKAGEKRSIELHLTSEILDSYLTYRLTASGWNEPAAD